MDFKTGIYEDLDYETYDSIPAWRSHDLTSIAKCPFTWKNKHQVTTSPALIEGRLQHSVFLELDKFDEEYVIEPPLDRRTKIGKAEYEDFMSGLNGRTPVKQDLFDVCMERREAMAEFIPEPHHRCELTLCWEWHGHPCKGKLDWHTGTDIWDLKTCRDASPRGFRSAINNFLYFQQAAYYLNGCRSVGLPTEKFYFLAVEKAHPYPHAVYTLSDEAIVYGNAKNEQALSLGLKCQENNDYRPFNNSGVVEFGVDELY